MFWACIKLAARIGVATLVGLLAATAAGAEGQAGYQVEYQEGTHYRELPIAVETGDASKVEVVEVFSYGCIHCYRLEPFLEVWKQSLPEDVAFRRLPLVTARVLPLAQAYFTAETLGVVESVHLPLFQAIHDSGIDMTQPQYIRRLFEREAQVTREDFQRVFDSFGIRSRVSQADAKGRAYRVMATPTLVVNGRYVAEVSAAGSMESMFRVVDYLIEKERQALQEANAATLDADPDSDELDSDEKATE